MYLNAWYQKLEKVVQEYNSLSFKLGLIGSRDPQLASVAKELELNLQSEISLSIDLKNAAKVYNINQFFLVYFFI